MTKPYNILRKKMSKKSREASAAKTEKIFKEMMALKELRNALEDIEG